MKVKIHERTESEVDVVLPLYRKHEMDNSTIFMRVQERGGNLVQTSVHVSSRHNSETVEIEITEPYRFGDSAREYTLGIGGYSCTQAEFDAAAKDAVKRVCTIEAETPQVQR